MREFEYRETKGFCRLCETNDGEKQIVIPTKLAGKYVQIILCNTCIKFLNAYTKEATQ